MKSVRINNIKTNKRWNIYQKWAIIFGYFKKAVKIIKTKNTKNFNTPQLSTQWSLGDRNKRITLQQAMNYLIVHVFVQKICKKTT
jgi:hypothetical protein